MEFSADVLWHSQSAALDLEGGKAIRVDRLSLEGGAQVCDDFWQFGAVSSCYASTKLADCILNRFHYHAKIPGALRSIVGKTTSGQYEEDCTNRWSFHYFQNQNVVVSSGLSGAA